MHTFRYKYQPSPVGQLTLIASDKGLAAVLWEHDDPGRVHARAEIADNDFPVLVAAARQLEEYFNKQRAQFELPFDPIGSDFQKQVWQALSTIPLGETRSYLGIAQQINNSKAVRAVGGANNKNPLAIVVPCHRVVGANGALVGFAGGLEAKAYLLALEGISKVNPQLSMDL